MKTYDHIIVGSGISGMTAALLLAQAGRKVLLVEKAAAMGGSLLRFHREGVPFDTGFHFTGGLGEHGILTKMLEMLGIRGEIKPIFLPGNHSQRIILEEYGMSYDLPSGIEALRERIAVYFPEEKAAINTYFDKLTAIYESSAELIFTQEDWMPIVLCPEDAVSLQQVLDDLTKNPVLKALLSIFCMCHGTKPEEVSFAAHSRVCYSLFESLARVERGGDAFIRAFRSRFKELGVEVLCNTHVVSCGPVADKAVNRFLLSNGEEVGFGSAVLTIHPSEILRLLPREYLRPAFVHRVEAFEESAGFFTIFATLDLPGKPEDSTIVSLLPSPDMNRLLTPGTQTDSALVIVRGTEKVHGRTVQTLTAFEPSFPEEVEAWHGTATGERPSEYQAYKERHAQRIVERILNAYPEYRGHLHLLDSASTLTYRDWLHSPEGAAYGIKQKVGQVNLVGKLPLGNLYAAGQSAVLPGIVGAMLSSFVVCRSLIGTVNYRQPVCS